MIFLCKRNRLKPSRKRAVSQVIGSLVMMAIVASVGSVVVFQALNGIQGFNNILTGEVTTKKDSASESILIEHVRFETVDGSICGTVPCVKIWFRNVGTTDSNIKTIKILRIDTQKLLVNDENTNQQMFVRSIVTKQYTLSAADFDLTELYKISITTNKGNSYSAMATSNNT